MARSTVEGMKAAYGIPIRPAIGELETPKAMTPIDCADTVFNRRVDQRNAVVEENNRRVKFFEKPAPVPPWNVKEMVKAVRELAKEAFLNRPDKDSKAWGGTLESWQEHAEKTLRDNLIWVTRNYERATGQPYQELLAEIYDVWPETAPPRPLNDEEIGQLRDLQGVFDEVTQKLVAVVGELDKLWEIIEVEREIVKGTAAQGKGRIERLVWWAVSELYDYLKSWTAFKKGTANNLPRPFANRPNGW